MRHSNLSAFRRTNACNLQPLSARSSDAFRRDPSGLSCLILSVAACAEDCPPFGASAQACHVEVNCTPACEDHGGIVSNALDALVFLAGVFVLCLKSEAKPGHRHIHNAENVDESDILQDVNAEFLLRAFLNVAMLNRIWFAGALTLNPKPLNPKPETLSPKSYNAYRRLQPFLEPFGPSHEHRI